jgi:hypothetical protein
MNLPRQPASAPAPGQGPAGRAPRPAGELRALQLARPHKHEPRLYLVTNTRTQPPTVFGVHRPDPSSPGGSVTHVLGFQLPGHARSVARALAAHRRRHGVWPPRDPASVRALLLEALAGPDPDPEADDDPEAGLVRIEEARLAELLARLRGTGLGLVMVRDDGHGREIGTTATFESTVQRLNGAWCQPQPQPRRKSATMRLAEVLCRLALGLLDPPRRPVPLPWPPSFPLPDMLADPDP